MKATKEKKLPTITVSNSFSPDILTERKRDPHTNEIK